MNRSAERARLGQVRSFGLLVAASVAALVSTSSAAFASYGTPGAPSANPAFALPLSGAITTNTTTWATLVMGKGDDDFDLFWQLFNFNASTHRFTLVTPPGVAANGGLMVASPLTGDQTLVGFGTSQGLQFSPLAASTSSGRSWSAGGLPAGLFSAPTVIGLSPSGRALALVTSDGQQVLTRGRTLTSWSTLVTKRALDETPAGTTCAIGSLEAVAVDAAGTPTVGASCRQPDTPGLFVDSDHQWHLADIPVPSALVASSFATIRLGASSALLAAVGKKTTDVVAAWEPSANRPWQLSTPLAIGSTNNVLATGTGPGSTQFIVLRSAAGPRADVVSGPGAPWQSLPALPAGTATVAIAPSGTIYALSVDISRLAVWTLHPASSPHWTKSQAITVPMAFGSSS